ncbi:PP2C family protein-serine/threonine phosphatase [Nocardioides mangrovi]|uniref:SpoIIE family protein phosphatase n=1 Tax=Nocardioides mangrovi TaxID=2874580 RepID=A0ABS7U908_9ACTN|nr:SpoIIE family protein phosphatase [Nocardioides mangrovi]MBZ5737463.1 SpoIIE family protein phosphatase [Nocardioides mangrovi]
MAGAGATYSARTVVRGVAAVVALLSIAVGILLTVTVAQFVDVQDRIEDELNPARVELGGVLALYVDQETGERGFILTGRDEFLAPYDAAGPQIDEDLALLREQVSPSVWRLVQVMDAAHEQWLRQAVRPELAAARSGDLGRASDLVATGTGRELFDQVRAAHAAADNQIAAEQLAATHRADSLLRRLSFLLALTVLAFLGTTLLGAAAFNRTLLRALAVLGRQSRAVAGGRLDQSVSATGPREVVEVGDDVDTMRRHLLDELDELDASRRAAEALELGEPAVAALQAALAPRPLRRQDLAVAGDIASAEGVLAGDFLDVVELDEHRVAVVLGDVSGHGPAAALVGLRLKIAIETALDRGHLADVAAVARGLLDETPETFVTLVVAIVDLETQTLSYVNAGHPPPLLGATLLDPTGPLVSAVLDDATWEVREVPFGPGDLLIAFSDGVLEARDDAGREFGDAGVRDAVRRAGTLPVDDLVRAVRSEVRDHEHATRDDVTILAVRPG